MSGTTRVSRYQKGKTRKIKTNLDLLEQEIVSGSGICWAICKSAPLPRQPRQNPTTQFFTGRMPFLPPNQQRQSTEGMFSNIAWILFFSCRWGRVGSRWGPGETMTCMMHSHHWTDWLIISRCTHLINDDCTHVVIIYLLMSHTHTHNHVMALLDFARDYPGEPAPER